MTLFVGIPACTIMVKTTRQHATPARYGDALIIASKAVPVLLPPVGEMMLGVLDRLDGLLLNGSPSNVHPEHYGVSESLTPDLHDRARDETTLPLVRAAIARGMPVLAICRGIQELNVAMGGTLHQQVQNLPGKRDHRGGPGSPDERYAFKHDVALYGQFADLMGCSSIMVNSVHQQGLDRVADGLIVEGVADDGTVEVVRVADARAFAFGVQYHPEWHVRTDTPSRRIFEAFGDACRAYAASRG